MSFAGSLSVRLAAGVLLTSVFTAATASDITEFSLPQFSQPGRIVGGPDGNLWFTEGGPNSGGGIGRITPSGVITQFPVTAGRLVSSGIVAGPDRNLWFTEIGLGTNGFIARMKIDGTITEFQLPSINGNDVDPIDIVNGSDSALWFTASEQVYDTNSYEYDCRQTVGRITTDGKITLMPYSGPMLWTGYVCPSRLAKGADGNLWFTSFEDSSVANDIIRITTGGTTTPFPLPNDATATDIVDGPDDNIWFTQNLPAIGRISPSGAVTNFPLPSDAERWPKLITRGPDGNLWFTEAGYYTPAIAKITPAGTITEFPLSGVPLPEAYPSGIGGITNGPDGKLWFTDTTNDKIGTFATTLSVPIEPSFSGAWFDPTESGHGLFVEVLPDNRFLAWWFTFAPDGGQAWFGGVGTYSGNTATITQVAQTTGGRFIPNFDPSTIKNTLWGTLTFTFDDCNRGRVDFDSVLGYGSGSMPLTRLTQIDGTTCPHSGAPAAPATTPSAITEYPISHSPASIVSGPDGNLWFTEAGSVSIGMITPSGVITNFPLPQGDTAPNSNIAVGPDGNLWFVEGGLAYVCPNSAFCPAPPCTYQPADVRVGQITPAGTVQDFVFPSDGRNVHGIASGPDGNLWLTTGNSIARITPQGSLTAFAIPTAGSDPFAIAKGSDGNLWFTEFSGNKIGRISANGAIEEFALPADAGAPTAIIAGPDGNLWLIAGNRADEFGNLTGDRIGRITPSGAITEFVTPAGVTSISSGPDGNIWFTEYSRDRIGKITPAGVIAELVALSPGTGAMGITSGPDGKLWFAEAGLAKVGTFATTLATPISSSFTGAWFDPNQSGHGLFVEVLPDNRFLAWWFTFAPDGGQAWFGGVGTYSGNTATITQVAQTTGGRFIPNFDPSTIKNTLWGTLTFTFDDCNRGHVDFDSVVGYGTGSMPLTRLTQIDGTSCP